MLRKVDIVVGLLFLTILVGFGTWVSTWLDRTAVDPVECEEASLQQVKDDLVVIATMQQILTQAVQELYTQVEQLKQRTDHGQD